MMMREAFRVCRGEGANNDNDFQGHRNEEPDEFPSCCDDGGPAVLSAF